MSFRKGIRQLSHVVHAGVKYHRKGYDDLVKGDIIKSIYKSTVRNVVRLDEQVKVDLRERLPPHIQDRPYWHRPHWFTYFKGCILDSDGNETEETVKISTSNFLLNLATAPGFKKHYDSIGLSYRYDKVGSSNEYTKKEKNISFNELKEGDRIIEHFPVTVNGHLQLEECFPDDEFPYWECLKLDKDMKPVKNHIRNTERIYAPSEHIDMVRLHDLELLKWNMDEIIMDVPEFTSCFTVTYDVLAD